MNVFYRFQYYFFSFVRTIAMKTSNCSKNGEKTTTDS
jgi:hypothetical protein